MKVKNWRKIAFILAIGGAIQFIILIGIAMIFYAGGNEFNPLAPGYSIWQNSWSDLGRTVAWSGENNFIAQVFFSLAMVLWGISFFPSIQALPFLFSESGRRKLFCRIGTISAYICVVTLFCNVVFFPLNIYPIPHIILSIIGYLALLIVELLYAIVMLLDENYPNAHAICFLTVAITIIIYLISNMLFPIAIFQKLVSITLVIATLVVFSSAWKKTNEKSE